jgi:hypothetical protein
MTQLVTRNLRDGRIRLVDGTGTPITKEVTLLEGNLQWTETDSIIEVKDRGALLHPRLGDEEALSGNFTVKYDEIYLATGGTFYQFINKLGPYSGNISTLAATSDVFAFHLEFYIADPTGATGELIRFNDTYVTQKDFNEGDAYNTVALSFRSFITKPVLSKADYP